MTGEIDLNGTNNVNTARIFTNKDIPEYTLLTTLLCGSRRYMYISIPTPTNIRISAGTIKKRIIIFCYINACVLPPVCFSKGLHTFPAF